MHVPRSLAAVALAALLSTDVAAQAPLGDWSNERRNELGWLVYNLGDLDGDGRTEIASAFPSRRTLHEYWQDVAVYSPSVSMWRPRADWHVLWELEPSRYAFSDRCGEALVVLRRDELGFEVAVGAPGSGLTAGVGGAVATWAGLDSGGPRSAWGSTQLGAEFGAALAALPDLDADGRAELAVGAPGIGAVELYLTTNGARCGVITDSAPSTRFGAALAVVAGDPSEWSGAELAVGAPSSSLTGRERGAVHVHTLADGARARSLEGETDGEHFGARIIARDLERDGAAELVVASLGGDGACASVSVACSGDLTRRWRYGFPSGAGEQGVVIDVCGDLNADGCDEVLVAFSPSTPDVWPEVVVLSGHDGALFHAIRSFHPERGPQGREFLAEPIGLRLRSRLGVASAGDQDGDGLDDVWIGMCSTRGNDGTLGVISLLSGASLGSSNRVAPVVKRGVRVSPHTAHAGEDRSVRLAHADLPRVWTSFEPDNSDADGRAYDCGPSAYGRCVRTLGDLNGDGWDEIWSAGVYADFLTHSSFVVASDARATGESFDAHDFYDATRVHDVDADGIDDFALSVAEQTGMYCETFGVVRLYSSATQRELREITSLPHLTTFGSAMARVGDVDGDGVAELAVATPNPECVDRSIQELRELTGCVSLLSLNPAASKNPCLLTLRGDATGADRFGRALVYGGDWDGDGVGDLAVGAPADSSRAALGGAVHIYSGVTWERIASFASDVPRAGFGRELAWARDVDGDNRADLIASAPWSGADQRGCVLMLGSKRGLALWCTAGAREFDAFGASLVVGDLDGDGREELVVGAPGANREAFPHAASVAILETTSGEVRATIEGELETPDAFKKGRLASRGDGAYVEDEPTLKRFGRSLAVARDLDGDKVADLVIGSPTYTGPGNAGLVYAFSGRELMKQVVAAEARRRPTWGALSQGPRVTIDVLDKLWSNQARLHDEPELVDEMSCAQSAFGRIVVNVGDQNGDSIDDLVLGAITTTSPWFEQAVELADGVTGRSRFATHDQNIDAVARVRGDRGTRDAFVVASGEHTGFSCMTLDRVRLFHGTYPVPGGELDVSSGRHRDMVWGPDIDGDGDPDLLVSTDDASSSAVVLRSGVPGGLGAVIGGPMLLGSSLAAGRDLDADGAEDLLVGPTITFGPRSVRAFSVAKRQLLAEIVPPEDAEQFGRALALVDDCNADGAPDILIGAPYAGPDRRGLVQLYSGASVELLHTWRGEVARASLGRAVRADADFDGDGACDFVITAPGLGSDGPRGAVYIVSPVSGKVLLRIEGEPRDPNDPWVESRTRHPEWFPTCHSFGWAVATGDFNGDGVADLAIGSPQAGPKHLVGIVYAISGVELRKHMAR